MTSIRPPDEETTPRILRVDSKEPIKNLQKQGRTQKGQFAKGHAQNPKGRKKGSRNKATTAALALMNGQLEAITQTLIDAALDGDLSAAKIILDKLVPPCRELPLQDVTLPAVTEAADLPKLTQRILEAVGNGEILPSQGHELLRLAVLHGGILSEFAPKVGAAGRSPLPPPRADEALRAILRGES